MRLDNTGTLAVITAGMRNWSVQAVAEVERTTPELHQDDVDARDAAVLADALRDRAAFAVLYHRYVDSIYSYCRRRLDESDAEDATSHIFMQALGHLESCRGPSFRAWLFRIAHNVVIDRQRKHKPTVPFDDTFDLVSGERSPEDLALEADRKRRLELAIRSLPPDQRAAVELRLAGLTGIECAQVLGKSADATRMLQHRAFGSLRTALADLTPGGRS